MIILIICVSPLHDIHPRIPEASPLRNETHRRLLRLKRFTYTINLDHYRSLLGTNSPGSDGARFSLLGAPYWPEVICFISYDWQCV